MKRITKIYIIILCFAFGSTLFFLSGIYLPENNLCREEVFSISPGQGFREIGSELENRGLIKNAFYFQAYVLFSGKYGKLQAGTYLLDPCRSAAEIANQIFEGRVAQKKITIIEGWNLRQIAEYLEEREAVAKEEFLSITEKGGYFENEFTFLKDKPKSAGLEGYLFPDTYSLPINSTAEEIIRILLSGFDSKLTSEMREEAEKRGRTIFEIVIMASLIEKEVRSYEDKELVSGIIEKRMGIGKPLQIDATISYITGRRTTRITIAETEIDSPYNTYKYPGLPVGPIASPGIESIRAAIFPKESNYLFYLSKPDGETVFSRTLEEHNIAKNRYLK